MNIVVRILAAAAILASVGCKVGGPVRMDPVSLSYVQSENLVPFDQPKQKLIRVAQFEDKRPDVEHKGDAPAYWELLLVAWRNGDYVTGDRVWSGNTGGVSGTVTSTLTDCLKRTNFFNEVQTENSAAPSGGAGLILKGQIDSFHASQHLKYYRYFFLFLWGKEETLSSPTGRCKLTYSLIDAETNQELKRNSVEAEIKDNKITIGEAGQRALSQANALVANEVTTRALME